MSGRYPYGPVDPSEYFGLVHRIAPGVLGYFVETPRATYLPIITAEHEGQGDVGRFLDGLDRTQTWKIPCVISARLRGMLDRRGWIVTREFAASHAEWVEVWVLAATGGDAPT